MGEAGLPPWGTDGGMPGRTAADRAAGDVEPEGGGLQQLAAPCPPWPHVATTRREAEPEGRMLAVEVVHPGWREEKGYNYPKAAQMHAAGARPRGWGQLEQRVSPTRGMEGCAGLQWAEPRQREATQCPGGDTVQRLRRTRF